MIRIDLIDNIFNKYYKDNPVLLATVRLHSELVARKSLEIARKKAPGADMDFIMEAALLHDIGVVKCHAPEIHCFGDKNYLCHGIEGRKILEREGMPLHALVCERHTGSGLTAEEIITNSLPLPARDMLPISIEEKIICYADKFYSKSGDLIKEKDIEAIIAGMKKHGEAPFKRFMALHDLFKSPH